MLIHPLAPRYMRVSQVHDKADKNSPVTEHLIDLVGDEIKLSGGQQIYTCSSLTEVSILLLLFCLFQAANSRQWCGWWQQHNNYDGDDGRVSWNINLSASALFGMLICL